MGSHISVKYSRRRVPATPEIQFILDSIRHIVQKLRESSRDAEKRLGISGAQLFVLEKLAGRQPLSLNQVAQRTFTHQSSVSSVVRALVERGLVQRNSSARDGRFLELSLTGRGKRMLHRSRPSAQQRLLSALQRLPAMVRGQLARALGELVHEMAILSGTPAMFFEDNEAPKIAWGVSHFQSLNSTKRARARHSNQSERR
jgi:DNA-binding MarR family transcriptional regulator